MRRVCGGAAFLARSVVLMVATVLAVSCTSSVTKSYQIDTAAMDCDAANRHVYDSLVSMGLRVTGFKVARPGVPGYVEGEREDSRGGMSGRVTIRCEPDGVHIESRQDGIANEQEFERGVLLGVTGRADLVRAREGEDAGKFVPRSGAHETAPVGSNSSAHASAPREATDRATGVSVVLERLTGFTTVLDFEADLSAAGILPVKVTITNGTGRAYAFDPRDVVLRQSGSRRRAYPMTSDEAVALLHDANRRTITEGNAQLDGDVGPVSPTASSDLGDVRAASRIIPERTLRSVRLAPGRSTSGFLYYPSGSYDRARVTMIDVATGETEGFIVEF
ncbi:MAG: hypothetical protein E4H03_01830 [Myxococcales bacterium]|nr:MAG: hypothetical protein E4H03_01830 [Myxococcales bacterium]